MTNFAILLLLCGNLAAAPENPRQTPRQIALNSDFTDANIYDILSVTLLATLGSFLLPSLSTFLTYLVASNRWIKPKKRQTTVLPSVVELKSRLEKLSKLL